MEKYVHQKRFLVKYSDVDFKDECKLSSALALFQEVACSSADELGFGYNAIKPKGLGFITAATYVEFQKPIKLGEVNLETWPTPPRHVIFERQYLLKQDGVIAATACSRWCLVNMSDFKMLPASTLTDQDYSTYNSDKCVLVPSWKVAPYEKDEEEAYRVRITYSDYDHYHHVNNTVYASFFTNCFSILFWEKHRVKSFLINYVLQAHEGDELIFYKTRLNEDKYCIHGICESTGEVVVSAEIQFEKEDIV